MNRHVIKMPDIGEGIAEVEIVEWHVAVGASVAEDQVLADVMTDKASVEIPSPISGIVVSLGGEVGDILAVGSELIVLEPRADGDDAHRAGAQRASDPDVQLVGNADAQQDSDTDSEAVSDANSSTRSYPPQKTETLNEAADAQKADVQAAPSVQRLSHSKALASPSVRRRARQLDIDLQRLASSDGDTHVTHADLDRYLLERMKSSATPYASVASDSEPRHPTAVADRQGHSNGVADTDVKVVGLRRQIARKMQESKQHIPHFSYVEEVDVTELERLRAALNEEQGKDQERLTLLPLLVRAIVLAVQHHPEINAVYDDEKGVITRFGAVHLGIATQTDGGLMVPVMRNAERLDLWECAAEIKRLATAARRGRLQRPELSGSTLTLSSLGALGGIAATPIINYPEVAIVGVNRVVERPIVVNGGINVRKMMNLSSSFDHRIVDGMNAAQFIQQVRRTLECPGLLFVAGHP